MSSRRLVTLGLLLLAVILVAVVLTQQSAPLPDERLAGSVVDGVTATTENTVNSLSAFLNRLIVTPQNAFLRLILIFAGILLLLVGWRIYDYIIVVAGVVIGASIALSLLTTDNVLIVVAAIVIGGLIGAAAGIFLYYVAVFFVGAYIGIALTGALVNALSTTPPSELLLLFGGILGGLILIALSFEFLVLLAAVVGAEMLTLGLGLPVIWTLIFAVVGVVVQLALMRTYNYDFRRRRRRVLVA